MKGSRARATLFGLLLLGLVGTATAQTCVIDLDVRTPVSDADEQTWLLGCDVQINGGVSTQEGCPEIERIAWDWGDGTSNDHWFPAPHTYESNGDYLVTVTPYDSDGNSTSATVPVSVVDCDDGDGVADADELPVCLDTLIPEEAPTSGQLLKNHYALTSNEREDGLLFFTSTNKARFTTADTGGCSCEQIVAALGLGKGHLKFGCSKSVMEAWIMGLRRGR